MPRFDFAKTAQDAYADLKRYFSASTNFWQLGNSFDTALEYQRLMTQPDQQLSEIALQKYQATSKPPSACWYDDYGWWGIASSKAYDTAYAPVFGQTAGDFKRAAVACWKVMYAGKDDGLHQGAANVWENRNPATNYWDAIAPRFHREKGERCRGVWQYDIFREHRDSECNSITNPSDPFVDGVILGPYQQTVVNGLYFWLAVRLWRAQVASVLAEVQEAARDEWGFLKAWFDRGTDSLLRRFSSDETALIRERVATYSTGGRVQHWDAETCWGGDQGLAASSRWAPGLVGLEQLRRQRSPTCPADSSWRREPHECRRNGRPLVSHGRR